MTDHESAAFNGASSVTKPEPETRVTYEEIMAQPWRYPQGRNVPATDDEWGNRRLSFPEMMLVIVIWALSFGAAVSVLVWVFG